MASVASEVASQILEHANEAVVQERERFFIQVRCEHEGGPARTTGIQRHWQNCRHLWRVTLADAPHYGILCKTRATAVALVANQVERVIERSQTFPNIKICIMLSEVREELECISCIWSQDIDVPLIRDELCVALNRAVDLQEDLVGIVIH